MPHPPDDPPIAAGLDLDLDVIVETGLPVDLDLDALHRLIPFVLHAEGAAGPWTVAVVLTDDDRLRTLHRDFMGLDTPTDVMTFPLSDGDVAAAEERGGDVIVSVERAAHQAAEYDQTVAQEASFLVVHGLLHLCGWDDGSDAERSRMLARQADLIAAFDSGKPLRATGP
ncbi:MAG: Metal-dependent hydrolase YbeY, involved in rRNA and/or ribosome maturation and assembly [uncultured Thermomicrobiales bacterium]|uniref:Endoribonuclease YbeY n=1 Tax=uncultured Thermomicrobiales bacterium TaxID=1645740 RepID=A0A6J4UEE3_9BACT|nr:MAG: Metal-dependent hydrolase YbeY, involved in rRNA and/or ribosome maturation and assembly [uncultured Thermomicrobiales bacterium]